MATVCVLVLLFLSLFYESTEAAEELTAKVVLDVLTRRLDYVTQEINTVKNGMAEIKLDVSKIEKRIENIETNVSNMIINLEDQKEADIPKSDMTDKFKRQSKVLQKMLVTEKVFLRRTVDEFSNMFNGFKSDINSHLTLMNISVGNSIENLEQVVTDYKSDTITTLLWMKFGLQTMIHETDKRVEDMDQEMKEMANETLEKINEVSESIQTKAKIDVDSAKQAFGSRLNSEISVLTTKLKALQQEQENLEQVVTDHKSDTNITLLEMKFGLRTMMTKTDKRVEDMEQEMKEMASETLEKINKVGESIKTKAKIDVDSAKQAFGSRLSSEISVVTTKLKDLQQEQGMQEVDFDDRINDLESSMSYWESYTYELGEIVYARKVAFSARQVKRLAYYGKRQRIVFDTVVYSHGGGYDSSTGIFTAPKSGTYLFIYNIESSDDGYVHVLLMIRGHGKNSAFIDEGHNNGGNAGVGYLYKGDKAWVQTASIFDRHYIWPYRTTFNGILID